MNQKLLSGTKLPKRKLNSKNLFKNLRNVAVVLVVFWAGINVGNGQLSFSEQQPVANQASRKLDYGGIEELYDSLRQSFDGQLEVSELEDGLKAGLVKAAGDPFTEYLNAEESKEFEQQLSGSFEGIGAELSKEENSIIIVAPIAGFPAERAGIKPRDIIVKINNETAHDLSITEAVKKIRGPKGTKVKLQVLRGNQTLDLEITRDQITIPSVTHEITDGNIGIIKLTRFGEDTDELTRKAAAELKAKNVKGVILDMRGNPGGLLESSVAVASVWLPKGKTVLEEKRDGKVIRTFEASGRAILDGMPTVVLVDEGSASASEIVAGALRDNKAATIIGTKTYGKGSVQEVKELRDGGVLKVTIARWFTPAGRNIDKEGIEPDQNVEISEEDAKAKKDPQKDAALAKLKR